jgi:hypothetical protein
VARFRVVVTGTGMDIPPEGCTGFATTRFVHAVSADEASKIALALVAASVSDEPAFASSPKPDLGVDRVFRVWSPLKLSRPNSGYSFIGIGADLDDILSIERQAGAGWFM